MGNRFFLLVFLAFILRVSFIFLPGFRIDVDAWFAWAIRLNEIGFTGFYSEEIWTNYTPGFLYILSLLGFLKNLLGIEESFFYLLLKIPTITAEFVLALFIYKKASVKKTSWALIASLLILFNPAFIFNSSIWGQIDGLLTLMLTLSVYYLNKKSFVLSLLLFSLGFLIKPQAIFLLPVFGLVLLCNLTIKNLLYFTLLPVIVISSLSLPFFINQPIEGMPRLFLKMLGDYPYTSLFAYNFWGSFGFWIKDNTSAVGNLTFVQFGYILFAFYWLIILIYFIKRGLSVYSLATLAALGFFFLPTRVHERYLYPALVFIIILVAQYKSKSLLLLTVFLSFIHFLNLYYVYVYYNEIFLKMPKILYNPFIYSFLDVSSRGLSILSTAVFGLISIAIIKYNHAPNKED